MLEKLVLPLESVSEPTADVAWYAALTLSERLATPQVPAGEPENSELARQRLDKWKQQAPFEQETFFTERLKQDHLSEQDLLVLLGESPATLKKRVGQLPPWATTLLQACEDYAQDGTFVFPGPLPKTPLVGFLEVCKPLLKQGYARLAAGIRVLVTDYRIVPFVPAEAGAYLFSHLAERLLGMVVKTLTLEVNIARLQNTLPGESSAQRFQVFVERFATPTGLLSLLELYPVLARKLVNMIDDWVVYSLEFLTHLCEDQTDIQSVFQVPPDQVVKIEGGVGDTHRQGRSVMQVVFRSGLKLIYKPRSLSIDQHFQTLLTWLNERGNHAPLRAAAVLERGNHGWAEYIEAQTCQSEEELQRFYQRLGSYLALLYVLTATDMHFENLIAAGEHPILIDLESLLQPLSPAMQADAISQSMHVLSMSVMRSGLLPRRILSDTETDGIDISGLGGQTGQRLPRPVALLAATGTDEMHFIQQQVELGGRKNRPTLQGAEIDTLDYLEAILTGFEQIYRLVLQQHDEFLHLVTTLFAQDEIRMIFRPTRIYGKILQESSHPTLLRNMLTQERFCDHLWNSVPQLSFLPRVIPAERQDLFNDDIPLFTTHPHSRDLFTSRGERIAEFFLEPALAVAERIIQNMDERDLERQRWIIRASFASTALEQQRATWKGSNLQPAPGPARRAQLLDAARAIGDQLCEQAIAGEHEVTWLNLHLVGERTWSVFITGASLYDGVAGIVLFLAYLGVVTDERRYTDLARHTFQGLREKLSESVKIPFGPGAFSGWGGLLYLYAHLGIFWQEPALFAEAAFFLNTYQEDITTDENLDIVGGVAGCILGLLALQRVAPSAQFLAAAIRCGNHLLERAQTQTDGLGWPSPLAQANTPLTGFSHGCAGIAYSLLALAEASGEERFRATALAALAYERSHFSPETRNWPDLRTATRPKNADEAPGHMLAWCHGAPGIALARLGSLTYLDDTTIREEIAVALETTLAEGFGANHSLCHGDFGNLDALLTASQVLNDARYRQEVERLTPMLLASIEREGWCTGVPLGIATPGLMTGIAGIGYELLRLAEPELVPSVLLLSPPVGRPEKGERSQEKP